jgi:hypothetical protein
MERQLLILLTILSLESIHSQYYDINSNNKIKHSEFINKLQLEKPRNHTTFSTIFKKDTKPNEVIPLNMYLQTKDLNIPSFSLTKNQTKEHIQPNLHVNGCNSCIYYNQISNITNNENVTCIFENYRRNFEAKNVEALLGKNLQVEDYNFYLLNGTIYVAYVNDFQINLKEFNLLVNYEVQQTFKNNIFFFRAYDIQGEPVYYLLTYNNNYIYVFNIYTEEELTISCVSTIDIIRALLEMNEDNFNFDAYIINFYFHTDGNINNLGLVLRENRRNVGLVKITSQYKLLGGEVDGLTSITAVKEIINDEESIRLDIIDSFHYVKEIQLDEEVFQITSLLIIKDYGLVFMSQETVVDVFLHPHLKKIDSISDVLVDTRFYIGLFVENTSVKEFFIELTGNSKEPQLLKLNRVYTSENPILGHVTDFKNKKTYFYNSTSLILIEREIPYEVKVSSNIVNKDITKGDVTMFSSNTAKEGYIALGLDDKSLSLVRPFEVSNNPVFMCSFREVGSYIFKIKGFKQFRNGEEYLSESDTTYLIVVDDRIVIPVWGIILIGLGGIIFVIALGFLIKFVVKRKKDKIDYQRMEGEASLA